MNHHHLCIDIGNTQMEFGLYIGDELVLNWRLSTHARMTADELGWKMYGMFAREQQDPLAVTSIMVASVVPHLDQVMRDACSSLCHKTAAFVGTTDVKTGIAIDYKNPKEVGADRIAAAIAAREIWGSPVIIMDCGTATTFDIVTPDGRYAGGLIVPGMEISLAALCNQAARLPEVSIAPVRDLIARDTVSSMQAGSYWATVDGLRGIIHRLQGLAEYANAPIIATGGLAQRVLADIPEVTALEAGLTLKGLLLLAKKQHGAH